jgi:predicted membrane channel-forming protein YqfA (hemolysin III family)
LNKPTDDRAWCASAVGGGDIQPGTGAFFPVVFGSLFLNWSFFARLRPVRWFGWLAFAGVGGITTTMLANSAELQEMLVWILSGAVGLVVVGGRFYLDRRFPEPRFWYNLGDKADPY